MQAGVKCESKEKSFGEDEGKNSEVGGAEMKDKKEQYKIGIGVVSMLLVLFVLVNWKEVGVISNIFKSILEPLPDSIAPLISAFLFLGISPAFSALIYSGLCRIMLKIKFKDNYKDARTVAIITYIVYYILFFFILLKRGGAALTH